MAAEIDRGALNPAARPSRGRGPWLLLIAVVCVLALLAVLLLQLQQLDRLNSSLHNVNEVRVVQMHRQETEYLQLREQWLRALDSRLPLDLRALTLRYDILVGRVSMLREHTTIRRLAIDTTPELDQTLAQVDAFVKHADPVLSDPLAPAQRRAALLALQPELLALGEPLHELSLTASHRANTEQTERNLALKQFTRITLALTGFLALLVLAFAGLSLRQMRQLGRRHDTLQALSADLHEAHRAAEAGNQAKSHFLVNMSHEIRTPFQGLLGMLSMLRDTDLDARQIDYLRTATESADHLLAVLNDILDMSQLEAGRLQINPGPVMLRTLLQDVESLMRPQASARNLALHVSIDPAVPERARLDATRVKQVLFNLLSNAIKFSRRGEVELELQVRPVAGGGEQLLFIVTDTGMGMDSEMLTRLFNRYERGQTTADPEHHAVGGNGLGLEISRSLARLMGGDLQVSSQPGQGSRFSFSVPLQLAPEGDRISPPRDFDGVTALQLEVLVAEDHPVNREVLGALLESMGHRALFVPNGDDAVAAVQQQRFDLVLMDLHMPGLDGIEATRQIRNLADRAAATVPIVALTADAFTDTRERCLIAGMNSFLSKPVSREKLGALMRQLFGSGAGIEPEVTGHAASTRPELNDPDAVPLIDSAAVARTLQVLTAQQYASMLAMYLDQAPATVDRLRKAVRDAQPQELGVHAHASRGAALNLGLSALAATAEVLQNGAAHLPAHEVARLVQRFDDLLTSTRVAAEQAGLLNSAVGVR